MKLDAGNPKSQDPNNTFRFPCISISAPVIGCASLLTIPLCRSQSSKLVAPHQQGKSKWCCKLNCYNKLFICRGFFGTYIDILNWLYFVFIRSPFRCYSSCGDADWLCRRDRDQPCLHSFSAHLFWHCVLLWSRSWTCFSHSSHVSLAGVYFLS